jgi:hypothetical protein
MGLMQRRGSILDNMAGVKRSDLYKKLFSRKGDILQKNFVCNYIHV